MVDMIIKKEDVFRYKSKKFHCDFILQITQVGNEWYSYKILHGKDYDNSRRFAKSSNMVRDLIRIPKKEALAWLI